MTAHPHPQARLARMAQAAVLCVSLLLAPSAAVAVADDPGASASPAAPALTGTIGDFVWRDASPNGIQGLYEPGINGVAVALLNSSGKVVSTTTTAGGGHYQFSGLAAATYVISFTRSSDYIFTEQNACGISCAGGDSDPNTLSGATFPIALAAGESNLNIDAGLIQIAFRNYMPEVDKSLPSSLVCDESSPYWKAVISGNPGYTFCVKQDLEFVAGWPSVVNFNKGDNKDLSLKWNIFGIGGIHMHIDPSTAYCGESGSTGTRNVAVNGSDGPNDTIYPMNGSEFYYGGYKIELYVINREGVEQGYNEKYLCVQ